MKDLITLGEILLRLSTKDNDRINQATSFDIHYGGGEANVAIALSNLGLSTEYITTLPKNKLGDSAINELRKYGVETSNIIRSGNKIGMYFLELGASIRGSEIIYDRANSSMALSKEEDYDFKSLLEGYRILHISGITPTLSDSCFKVTMKAIKAAKELGVKVSFDLNYRKQICTYEQAKEYFNEIMPLVDICIGTFEFSNEHLELMKGTVTKETLKVIAKDILKAFNCQCIMGSFRESHSASKNSLEAFIYDGESCFESSKYTVEIVDRVGTGDALASGFLYSLLTDKNYDEAIDFANAAFAYKHTIKGDQLHCTLREIDSIKNGNISGVIKR